MSLSLLTSFFTGGAGWRTYVMAGLAFALLIVGGFAYWQLERVADRDRAIGRLDAERAEAIRTAQENADSLSREIKRREHADQAVAELEAAAANRSTTVRTIIKEVRRVQPAPAVAGCPNPDPVFAPSLDGVRQLLAGPAADKNPR